MKPGEWAADPAPRGAGVLQVRKLVNGEAAYYYRYTAPDGERVRVPIAAGIELAEARKIAARLSGRYQAGDRDLRDALDAEQREATRLREAAQREVDAAAEQKRATLAALLTAYVEQLRRDGKPSMRSVERALQRHVADAWPTLWNTPVAEITTDDLLAVIARVADAGKLREAAKVRSYLTAAFAAGLRARQDARGLPALRALRITSNPARDLVTIEGATNARERALSVAELRAYWKRISALPDPAGALLRFHLLTGGQRTEQLARLTTADHDSDVQTVRLRDGKGRRKVARIHDVPLIPEASRAMKAMRGGALGPHVFTVTAGESGAVYATVQHRAREVAAAMAEAGELEKGPFTVGDLRRTVETRLAAAGVGVETRAQLQSHGLGGIQARHYDRQDYLAEKRAALETLHRLATGAAASVTPIKRKTR
ncbi:tyrosine-type recombinase/integrase [Dokdonella soli]